MSVYRLDDELFDFPSPEEADVEYDGLLAVGGDYNPERLLRAYSNGIFPWPVAEGRPITWFSPDPRFVLKAEDFRIPKSLKKTLKKGIFDYRVNTAFAEVIHECSTVPRQASPSQCDVRHDDGEHYDVHGGDEVLHDDVS